MEQFKGQPRLPKFAVPKRYDIRLKPDLAACKFAGSVAIDLDVVSETKFIVLNAAELSVTGAAVSFTPKASSQVLEPCKVDLIEQDQILVLEFGQTLPIGLGVLAIGFEGTLNDRMKGFYRSKYEHNGEKKNMAKSLAAYIKKHACSNAKTEDLWAALEEGSGEPVNKLMNSWTKQKGYPVVSVSIKDQKLEFEQTQFLSSGSQGDGQWIVPITLCCGSYEARKNFLLQDRSTSINADGAPSWIKISNKVARIAADATPELMDNIKQFFINLFQYSAEKLGWEPKQGESHLDAMLRGEILTALAVFGHEETLKEASRRFNAFLEDRNTPFLPPDTRR
ncbi:hypothetical protein CRG98_007531, partial [Punica granatum]